MGIELIGIGFTKVDDSLIQVVDLWVRAEHFTVGKRIRVAVQLGIWCQFLASLPILGSPDSNEQILWIILDACDAVPVSNIFRKGNSCVFPVRVRGFGVNESEHPFILSHYLVQLFEILNETNMVISEVKAEIPRSSHSLTDTHSFQLTKMFFPFDPEHEINLFPTCVSC